MARQLQYTSVARGPTGRAGFQFVAGGDQVPVELLRAVEPFMTYRPPPDLPARPDPEDLGRFPLSLAYDRTPHGVVVVCCRYLGRDYSGRYGNFLGHAVLARTEELDGVRPIELWRAPFWPLEPAATATDLGELDSLVPGEAVDPDRVAAGLAVAGDPGFALLAVLIAAVRATLAGRAGHIALVSTDVDTVARWIAAVCYSLPFDDAAAVSFVTYTADPNHAPQLLVGTTPDVWSASTWEGPAFLLDELRTESADTDPGRFASNAAGHWRSRDFAGIDALCDLATAAGNDADAAAALMGWCRGELVSAAERARATQLLRSLPAASRNTLLEVATATLEAASDDRAAVLSDELCEVLIEQDWSSAPKLGRMVLTGYGRRHRGRRLAIAERLIALHRVAPRDRFDLGPVLCELWRSDEPTPAECVRLLATLDTATSRSGAVRALMGRAFAAAPVDDPEVRQLAADVVQRLPAWDSADARLILALAGASRAMQPSGVADHLGQLAEWHDRASHDLATRVVEGVAEVLAAWPVTDRVTVLLALPDAVRAGLLDVWMREPLTQTAQTDLVEIAIRLDEQDATSSNLAGYVRKLMRRRVAAAKLARALEARDSSGELVARLRALTQSGRHERRRLFRPRPRG